MTSKLTQKHPLKGTREFELLDEEIRVRIKPRFGKEEQLSVMLTVLNPEPLVGKSLLAFTSRVNNEPLLELFLARPDAQSFNAFVDQIKQKARNEFAAFAGIRPGGASAATPSGMQANSYEEPPEFATPDSAYSVRSKRPVNRESVASAIEMLQQHLSEQPLESFIAALEALKAAPDDDDLLNRLVDEFTALGPAQGAVLTYAPYIGLLLSDDPFTRP